MFTVQTVRIYPTDAQKRTLNSWMRLARRVWNHYLEQRIKIYKRRGESASYFSQNKMLTRWRANDERMRAMPLEFQRDALDRLHKAFDGFFRRTGSGAVKVGFPRFKGRGRWRSLNNSQPGRFILEGKVLIPKMGAVKCRNLRPIEGVIKAMRVVLRADRWFAQLLIDDGKQPPPKVLVKSSVGIDVGLKSFATLSDGSQVAAPQEFRRIERRLRRANRTLVRKRKNSKRRQRARLRLARIHMKAADRRSEFTHKLSKRIVESHDLIAVEDLNIASMTKGRFAKSIKDAAWSQFTHQIAYKAERAGKTFVRIDPRGTTQNCSQCNEHVPKTLSVRVHDCPKCGLSIDRDVNAARNILARAVPTVGGEITHGETPLPDRRKAAGKGRRTVKA